MMSLIPEELRFAVTRKCNGNCRHCYNDSGHTSDLIPLDYYLNIIEEIKKLNPSFDRITLSGGEPMLMPENVFQITRKAKSLGIRVRLVTRGWELTQKTCAELKSTGVTRIQIGLDSSGAREFMDSSHTLWDTYHSWLRGDPDGFKLALKGIINALDAGLGVSVRYSLSRSNLSDLVSTYQKVSSLGVEKFKFRVLFPDGRAENHLVNELIDGKELAVSQYELIKASHNNKTMVEITQPCAFPLLQKNLLKGEIDKYNAIKESCICGTKAAYFDSNGDIKYCLFDHDKIGNILEQSFLDIWNSNHALEVRKKRCPIDLSGVSCSSFKMLFERFKDYTTFSREYLQKVKELSVFV